MGVNAGDGKTTLLPRLESEEQNQGTVIDIYLHGRCKLTLEYVWLTF